MNASVGFIEMESRECLPQPDDRKQQYRSHERHHIPQPVALSLILGNTQSSSLVALATCATVATNRSILKQVGHVVLAFLVAPGETRKSRGGLYRSFHASLISFVSCFR
jgi:hypothetical protein